MGLQKALGLDVPSKSAESEPMNIPSWSYIRNKSMRLIGPDASFTDISPSIVSWRLATARLCGGFTTRIFD